MGRHNASNGRAIDPTYDSNRWEHPAPYGKGKGDAIHTPEEWAEMCRKDPTLPMQVAGRGARQ